jgi:hypothetical protein
MDHGKRLDLLGVLPRIKSAALRFVGDHTQHARTGLTRMIEPTDLASVQHGIVELNRTINDKCKAVIGSRHVSADAHLAFCAAAIFLLADARLLLHHLLDCV